MEVTFALEACSCQRGREGQGELRRAGCGLPGRFGDGEEEGGGGAGNKCLSAEVCDL